MVKRVLLAESEINASSLLIWNSKQGIKLMWSKMMEKQVWRWLPHQIWPVSCLLAICQDMPGKHRRGMPEACPASVLIVLIAAKNCWVNKESIQRLLLPIYGQPLFISDLVDKIKASYFLEDVIILTNIVPWWQNLNIIPQFAHWWEHHTAPSWVTPV